MQLLPMWRGGEHLRGRRRRGFSFPAMGVAGSSPFSFFSRPMAATIYGPGSLRTRCLCLLPLPLSSSGQHSPPLPPLSSTVETGEGGEKGGKGGGSQGIVVIFYVGLLLPPPSSLFLPSNISSCPFFPLFLSHNKPARQGGREGEGTDDMTHCCHCEGHSRSLFLPPRPSCAPRRKSSPFPSLPIPPFFHDKFLLTTSAHWQEESSQRLGRAIYF